MVVLEQARRWLSILGPTLAAGLAACGSDAATLDATATTDSATTDDATTDATTTDAATDAATAPDVAPDGVGPDEPCAVGCAKDGVCQSVEGSALDTACGADGHPCMDCASFGDTCNRRRCLDPHQDPEDGSCDNGCRDAAGACHVASIAAQHDAFCGGGGQLCDDCAARGLTCGNLEGRCTDCTQLMPLSNQFSGGGAFAGETPGAPDAWLAAIPSPVQLESPELGDIIVVQHFAQHGVTPTLPATPSITPTTMTTCQDCVLYFAGCATAVPEAATCARTYLAQSGTLDYRVADLATHTFIGLAYRLHFVRWDAVADLPLEDGGCIDQLGLDWHAGP